MGVKEDVFSEGGCVVRNMVLCVNLDQGNKHQKVAGRLTATTPCAEPLPHYPHHRSPKLPFSQPVSCLQSLNPSLSNNINSRLKPSPCILTSELGDSSTGFLKFVLEITATTRVLCLHPYSLFLHICSCEQSSNVTLTVTLTLTCLLIQESKSIGNWKTRSLHNSRQQTCRGLHL